MSLSLFITLVAEEYFLLFITHLRSNDLALKTGYQDIKLYSACLVSVSLLLQ